MFGFLCGVILCAPAQDRPRGLKAAISSILGVRNGTPGR